MNISGGLEGGTRRRRRFRPALWPSIAALLALVALLGLGVWQLERLQWKTALIDRLTARMSAEAVPLPATIDNPAEWEYRRVTLAGTFLNDHELHLIGRQYQGRPGWHVVTPLLRDDGGPAVLVDRGWVPEDRIDPATRAADQPQGRVVVEGVVRVPAGPGWFTPDNRPDSNVWLWADIPAMAAAAGLDSAAPVVIDAAASPEPGALPIGGQTAISLSNNHLQYALTWFSLAVCLVVIYILFSLERPSAAKGPSADAS